jgi:hypothetical protein
MLSTSLRIIAVMKFVLYLRPSGLCVVCTADYNAVSLDWSTEIGQPIQFLCSNRCKTELRHPPEPIFEEPAEGCAITINSVAT